MPKATSANGLTEKEDKFCREYAKCLNATQAALRAGYSPRSAHLIGHENLKKTKIQTRLGAIASITPETVINEVVHIAMARVTDVASFSSDSMTVKSDAAMSDRGKAALKSLKFTETYTEEGVKKTIEFTMHDKLKALDTVMRKFKMYPPEMKVLEAIAVLLDTGMVSPELAQTWQNEIIGFNEKVRGLPS